MPYYVNARNIHVSEAAATSAIQAAAAAWQEQTEANIELRYAGSTSASAVRMNHQNEVFFRGGPSDAVAVSYTWSDASGTIVDGDIVFYEEAFRLFAGSGCSYGIYIETAGVHEFGHILGLSDSERPANTMYPVMAKYCERNSLVLAAEDIATVESLYQPLSGVTSATVAALSSATATPSAPSLGVAGPDRNGTLYVTNTYKWPTTDVPFYINTNSVWLTGSEAIDSLRTAAAAWTLQSRANVRFVYAGTTSGSSVTVNRKNEVFFRNDTRRLRRGNVHLGRFERADRLRHRVPRGQLPVFQPNCRAHADSTSRTWRPTNSDTGWVSATHQSPRPR